MSAIPAMKPNNVRLLYRKNDINNLRVYMLTYGTCSKVYIGQTERSFKLRHHEHYRFYKKNKKKLFQIMIAPY